jgi:hypothetical protein
MAGRGVDDEKLHIEAAVHRLALSALLAAVLTDVDRGQPRLSVFRHCVG